MRLNTYYKLVKSEFKELKRSEQVLPLVKQYGVDITDAILHRADYISRLIDEYIRAGGKRNLNNYKIYCEKVLKGEYI